MVLWSIARASPTYTNNGSQRSARSINGCGSSGSDHSSDAALGAVSKENSEDPRPRCSRVFKPRSQPTPKPHVTACKIRQMEVDVVERVMGVGHSKVEGCSVSTTPKETHKHLTSHKIRNLQMAASHRVGTHLLQLELLES